MIPFLKPLVGEDEINAVVDVMRTPYLSGTGPKVEEFQDEFAKYVGSKYTYAVNSGTSALELVFQAFVHTGKLRRGDCVLIPSFTFVAVANAVVNAGLRPIFADVNVSSMNMHPFGIHRAVRAIVVVHTFGRPCDMELIMRLAEMNDLFVVEDCAEALGAEYKSRKVGCFGDCAVYSFHPSKTMTTGEGGMVTTRHEDLATKIEELRSHGFIGSVRDACVPGHNYRMSNILAAVGLVQLRRLDWMVSDRISRSRELSDALLSHAVPVYVPYINSVDIKHVYQFYTIQLESGVHRDKRDDVVWKLNELGIEAKTYFDPPIHMQRYYNRMFETVCGLPVTESLAERVLTLPMYPQLTDEEIDYMAKILKEVLA